MADVQDPAGVFQSDAHRRVLGHLSVPSDSFGWSLDALVGRVGHDDPHTNVSTSDEIDVVLSDLNSEGFAESVGGVWRQTQLGFEKLTGPIADEPGSDPDSSLVKPALIGGPVVPVSGPTTIPSGASEVSA